MHKPVKRVLIVGGGSAGWITAALLVRLLGKTLEITLVESEAIGIIGVGEATIPPILTLNNALNIDEREFIARTNATIKLGIEFDGWHTPGQRYMHAFGHIGKDFPFCGFHHFWLRHQAEGGGSSYWDYSLNYQAAKANRFAHLPAIEQAKLQGLVYAYHFDAALYAGFLREYAEARGVTRVEGTIEATHLNSDNGFINGVHLSDGRRLEADLFIDASGFHGVLIENALNTGYDDWRHWLPCDTALAVPSESVRPLTPYTRSTAREAGWQWRIPVQGRIGNGLVYCSEFIDDDSARESLLDNLDGAPLADARKIPFTTGRRKMQWHKNCVAVGLASGFIEPLESTSIHLVQSSILRLVKYFPHHGIKPAEVKEFNQLAREEMEHLRDFIVLHYVQNQRPEEFWRYCRDIPLPDSLQQKIDLFQSTGKVYTPTEDLFSAIAWQQVMLGQGIQPGDYHPLASALSEQQLAEFLDNLKTIYGQVLEQLPDHEDFLNRYTNKQ